MLDQTAITLVARFADGSTMRNNHITLFPFAFIGMKLHLVFINLNCEEMVVTITDGEWFQASDQLRRLQKMVLYVDFNEDDEKKFRPLMEKDPWWVS
jgi:hypothetical protein